MLRLLSQMYTQRPLGLIILGRVYDSTVSYYLDALSDGWRLIGVFSKNNSSTADLCVAHFFKHTLDCPTTPWTH